MKLGIIGSRNYTDYNDFQKFINEWIEENGRPRLVVSGGASGADSLAERFARENEIETLIFQADWQKFGKAAGPIRNKMIVKNSDCIIAFLSNTSRGTLNAINQAKKQGIKVVKIEV